MSFFKNRTNRIRYNWIFIYDNFWGAKWALCRIIYSGYCWMSLKRHKVSFRRLLGVPYYVSLHYFSFYFVEGSRFRILMQIWKRTTTIVVLILTLWEVLLYLYSVYFSDPKIYIQVSQHIILSIKISNSLIVDHWSD